MNEHVPGVISHQPIDEPIIRQAIDVLESHGRNDIAIAMRELFDSYSEANKVKLSPSYVV